MKRVKSKTGKIYEYDNIRGVQMKDYYKKYNDQRRSTNPYGKNQRI